MFLRRIEMDRFLSFGQRAELVLGPGLTVVTGPNAAGKSNIGRCLDVARAVLAAHDDPEAGRLDLYQDAGYEGAPEFTIRLGIDLDQGWEQDLVRAYVRASYLASRANQDSLIAESFEKSADWLVRDSVVPLMSGVMVIRYRRAAARPWSAAWQFTDDKAGTTWHAVLAGDDGIQQLRPGTAEHPARTGGAMFFADWLMNTKPQDETLLDFRAAMQVTAQPVIFSASTGEHQAGSIPASIRDLGLQLGIAPEGRMFSFNQVIRLVLQRGIVLTDNRRLPLQRRFPICALSQPADLRDGAAVGAEIFRLKNGGPQDRAAFCEIQSIFTELTGRELEVRARPAPGDDGEPAMIIEPVVAGHHGERPVELSGAGIQEALVLSVLLRSSPGRVTVLDEPAVNLEPTVQRRLTGRVRGPGQYLVITHNADLVPFEEQSDLERIIRVAPGTSGSEIRQPDYGSRHLRDQLRQLQLLQPAEVRSLLFARAVILCEGQTEVGALPRWWHNARAAGLPDPAIANIAFISVLGHSGYRAYIMFLDAFAIPWAIVSDGPALRKGQKLPLDLQKLGHWPELPEPAGLEDFTRWRSFWEQAGVFTLADQFGDDGSKGGELEALLEQIDPELLARANRETGGSKPRAGAYFAAYHPDPPAAVLDLYKKITGYLGLRLHGRPGTTAWECRWGTQDTRMPSVGAGSGVAGVRLHLAGELLPYGRGEGEHWAQRSLVSRTAIMSPV